MTSKMMDISDKGILEIAEHEGLVPAPYLDSKNVWTWGVGHTHAAGGVNPAMMDPAMPADINGAIREAIQVFQVDLATYVQRVNEALKVKVSQHEFDALVSFDYNTGGIHRAKLTKALNAGNRTKAAQGFLGWLRPPEIRKRRTAEMNLFITGDYDANGSIIPVWKTNGQGKLEGVMKTIDGRSLLKQMGRKPQPAPRKAAPAAFLAAAAAGGASIAQFAPQFATYALSAAVAAILGILIWKRMNL